MACLKEEFKSRTKINKFNIKEEFHVFGLWLEIFKSEKGIHICVSKKELDKIYQRICSLSKKLVSTVGVKTVLFVIDLNSFINNKCTILTNQK